MVSLASSHLKSVAAFIAALSQQDQALPASLVAQINVIGQNLEGRAVELPTIAASHPELNRAYQSALNDKQGEGATLISTAAQQSNDALLDQAVQILTQSDPVQAAKQQHRWGTKTVASNPLKRLFRKG